MPRIDEVLRKTEGKLKNLFFNFSEGLSKIWAGFSSELYFITKLQPSIRMLSDADKLRPSLSSALSETERSEVSDNVSAYLMFAVAERRQIWV
jgi:hypothetical protein